MGFGLVIAALLGLCGAALAPYVGVWPALALLTICIVAALGLCYRAINSRGCQK